MRVSPKLDVPLRTPDVAIPEAIQRLEIPGAAVGLCNADAMLWSAGFGTTAKGSVDDGLRFVSLSSMGEILDLRDSTVSYANIELTRDDAT